MLENGRLSQEPDDIAPDSSEVRHAGRVKGASLCQCTLLPGTSSSAVRHRTIEEIWLFVEGRGQVWRKLGEKESCVDVGPGSWLTIPCGAHFQFRNIGDGPLRFVISTIPPWPGPDEAVPVEDYWDPVQPG